ncbi:hypothetical protein D3C80_1616330 [compost metagenome]
MASISSAEPASGFNSLTVISGYFALKAAMTSPYPHQSCGRAMVVSMPSFLAASMSSALGSADATAVEAITIAVDSASRRRLVEITLFSPLRVSQASADADTSVT